MFSGELVFGALPLDTARRVQLMAEVLTGNAPQWS
jgi:hypothetical protein